MKLCVLKCYDFKMIYNLFSVLVRGVFEFYERIIGKFKCCCVFIFLKDYILLNKS